MCHALTAVALKKKVQEIVFLPVGFYAQIDDLESEKTWKQLLILLAGPASFLFSNMIIEILYSYQFLSIYGLNNAKEVNLMIALFNLLPVIPLDGGRIIKALLSFFTDEYRARKISLGISITTTIALIYFGFIAKQYVILGFVIINVVMEIFKFKKSFKVFLMERYGIKLPTKIKISKRPAIYRFYHNFYLRNYDLIEEKEIIKICLRDRRKTSKSKAKFREIIKQNTKSDIA